MNQIIKDALKELSGLSDEQQKDIGERLRDLIARAKIDQHLADAERRGGTTPSDRVFAELRRELLGQHGD